MAKALSRATTRRGFLEILVGTGGLAALSGLAAACSSAAPSPTAAPAAPAPPTTAPAATPTPAPAAPTATPAAQAAPASAGQLKISFWSSYSGVNGQAQQELVNRFAKAQDKIALDYQFQGSYAETATKLSAAIAAKQAPDASVLSDVWWQKFWLGKLLAPANPYMQAAGVSASDYVDSFINEGSRNGNVFWIPFARSTPLFYYNADMFSAAGFDHAPATWDEFQTMMPKLAKRNGDTLSVAAFASPNDASSVAWVFQPIVWAYGGRYSDDQYNITLDQPPAITAGQLFSDLMYKLKVASTPKDINVDFQNGLAASMLQSTAALAQIEGNSKFKVGTAFLPTEKQFGCCTGGAGMGLLSTSSQDKQAAAFTWAAFATSDDQTTYWSQTTGYMPVKKKAIAGDQMAAFYQKRPNFKTAVDQLAKTQGQDWARVGIPNGDTIIGQGIDRIIVNHEDPATVFADVANTLRKEGAPILQQLKALG
jgi:sn-glycerol 3-phosphate transport system substrate-binding protein